MKKDHKHKTYKHRLNGMETLSAHKISKDKASKNNGAGKWVALGLGLAATGALSYFGYQYWKKRKAENKDSYDMDDDTSADSSTPPKHQSTNISHASSSDSNESTAKNNFPLTKGSKGELVKQMQLALIAKYGKSILPKYGADGDFGSEMVTALKKAGLPETISETTYNLMVKGTAPDYSQVAKGLYEAASRKDFSKAMSLLKTLRNANDYKSTSEAFKNYRIGSVRQTLVNGMLNSFNDVQQKEAIRLAFSSMGLTYDGNKWALSGLSEQGNIITTRVTKVWANANEYVEVPANMVLGNYITERETHTLFENGEAYYLVQTSHIKPYKS